MAKIYIQLKSGQILSAKAPSINDIHKALSDWSPFIMIWSFGWINKFEISNYFESKWNDLIDKISELTPIEQITMWQIIKDRKKNWFPIKSFDGLMNVYKRYIKEWKLDKIEMELNGTLLDNSTRQDKNLSLEDQTDEI